MLFWILAIALTAISCAVLLYAGAAKRVNAPADSTDPAEAAHRAMLADIEKDYSAGRLSEAEAETARAELAREVIRSRAERKARETGGSTRAVMFGAAGLAVLLSFAIYAGIGNPGLPSAPLVERIDEAELQIRTAIARMETHLAANPDDIEGWKVLAPVYMGRSRFADASTAFERIVDLGDNSADARSDLAEALMMEAGGQPTDRSIELWREAAEDEPAHVRSRFYLAGAATQAGRYRDAVDLWQEVLALADGSEPWFETATGGLALSRSALGEDAPLEAAEDPDLAQDQQQMIRGMVEGLAARLQDEGGTVEEWTRLVRSRLVLGEADLAQDAYDRAVAAYPDPAERNGLDALAMQGGLDVAGDAQ